MSKSLLAVLMLLVGLGAGWMLRGAIDVSGDQPRASRTSEAALPAAEARREARPEAEIDADSAHEVEPESPEGQPSDEAPARPVDGEQTEEPKKKGNFLLAQIPQARKGAEEEGREKAALLAKAVGIDEERAARMAEVFAKHAGDLTEEIMTLLFGDEEVDDETLRRIDEGIKLNADLERDLSLFLSDEEVLAVRREMDAMDELETEKSIDSTIESLAMPDLSERQRAEVRDVLRADESSGDGVATLKAMRTMFREPDKAQGLADDKEFVALLKKEYTNRREQFGKILTEEQFKRYESWERRQIAEARMGVRMIGMIAQMEGVEGEAGASGNSISIGFGVGRK